MVRVPLREGQVRICLDTDIHPNVVTRPKPWMQKKSYLAFALNVPPLNKLVRYENLTNCLKIWSEDSRAIKP